MYPSGICSKTGENRIHLKRTDTDTINNDNVIEFKKPDKFVDDPITDVLRKGARKLLMERIFGGNCTILECACMNHVEYCMKDCNLFPCENFRMGPYPFFGQGFLDMQARRRRERPPAFDHNGRLIKAPTEYWKKLSNRDVNNLLILILFTSHSSGGLLFHHHIQSHGKHVNMGTFANGQIFV